MNPALRVHFDVAVSTEWKLVNRVRTTASTDRCSTAAGSRISINLCFESEHSEQICLTRSRVLRIYTSASWDEMRSIWVEYVCGSVAHTQSDVVAGKVNESFEVTREKFEFCQMEV